MNFSVLVNYILLLVNIIVKGHIEVAHKSFWDGEIINKVRKLKKDNVKEFALNTFFISLNMISSVLVNWISCLVNYNVKGHLLVLII